MVSLEDFTRLALGSKVPAEGRVSRCPKCGRSGIEQRGLDGGLYLHAQTSEVMGDGMRTEPRDCCRL